MSTAAPTTLTLELVLVDELPVGRVVDAGGRAFAFSGWLGLASAIEGATAASFPLHHTDHLEDHHA